MAERSRLRELIDAFVLSGRGKVEIDALLTDLERSAKAMGAYEAGRDHAPAIAQLVEANTRLGAALRELVTAVREYGAELKAARAVGGRRSPRLSEATAELAIRLAEADAVLGRHPQETETPAWGPSPEPVCDLSNCERLALSGSSHCGLHQKGGHEQDRAAAAIRPADRCVGFEPHPLPMYADEFCVAPVYEAKPGEVARPRFCGRPRSEHEAKK